MLFIEIIKFSRRTPDCEKERKKPRSLGSAGFNEIVHLPNSVLQTLFRNPANGR